MTFTGPFQSKLFYDSMIICTVSSTALNERLELAVFEQVFKEKTPTLCQYPNSIKVISCQSRSLHPLHLCDLCLKQVNGEKIAGCDFSSFFFLFFGMCMHFSHPTKLKFLL